jgi:hypothetical protein
VRTAVRENRAFLGRAVRYLAGEAQVSQFLDIGAGLPSANNVHEVAQGISPEARVVYADNDPIVLAHARALLASGPNGATAYLDADIREPEKIISDPVTRSTLDFTRPIALMLVAVLHFVPDEDGPRHIVRTLVDALPPGSYVVASHATAEHNPEGLSGAGRAYEEGGMRGAIRTSEEFTDLFSAAWNSSTRAWCSCRNGVPRGRASGRSRTRSTPTAAWPGSRDRRDPGARLPLTAVTGRFTRVS